MGAVHDLVEAVNAQGGLHDRPVEHVVYRAVQGPPIPPPAIARRHQYGTLGLIVFGAALLAPLVTWLPMLAARFPGLGLPPYDLALGTDLWQMHVLWLAALGVIAALIWPRDRWLASAVLFGALMVFWRGALIDPRGTAVFAVGALLLTIARETPATWYGKLRRLIAYSGIFQAAYVTFEMATGYDPIWAEWNLPWHPWTLGQGPVLLPIAPAVIRPLGTLATVDGAGAWIAITAPLMPLWALPLAAWALWQGFSIGACAAFTVGLLVKYALLAPRRPWSAVPVLLTAPLFLGTVAVLKGFATPVIAGRLAIWRFGLHEAATTDPILGWGIGNWDRVIPSAQLRDRVLPNGEYFRQAHNEYLQWACEVGVVGLILLVGWLWTHRAMFRHPVWGPSLAALGVNSLSFFPFHVPALALLGLGLIGAALSAPEDLHALAT